VRTYRSRTGPFPERPYYKIEEIERTCTIELSAVGLLPTEPSPVRIERFIEKKFGVVPQYDDLPEGILGFSRFGPKGLEAVVISRDLVEEDSKSAQRRANTTLAHEAGHALFHAHLFVLGAPQPGMFGNDVTEPKILCRCDSVHSVASNQEYDGRWWEFQANQAIGPLLMPRRLVHKALAGIVVPSGSLGVSEAIPDEHRETAVALLAKTFEVNPAVARIRIQELYRVDTGQLTL